jgi:hypothetical protein
MSQLPPDLENTMAPGGSFPGHAQTLATLVGSDTPVQVKIGQNNDPALSLSKTAYRERAAQQRDIDAQTGAGTPPTQGPPQVTNFEKPEPPPEQPPRAKRGRPKGARNKPKPAGPKAPPSGPPSPAPSTTAAPVPIPPPNKPALTTALGSALMEERMARLERGLDRIVGAIAERDEMYRVQDEGNGYTSPAMTDIPPGGPNTSFLSDEELTEEDEDEVDEPDDGDDFLHGTEPVEPGESSDKPPLRVVATRVEDAPDWDKGLEELQQMIQKRNPQKLFRQYWCQLSRVAQYNEWRPERREAFDKTFNEIVAHPKFVHQMSTFMRGARGGNCVGNEQIARVCGMVAGFLTVYQLAAAGK